MTTARIPTDRSSGALRASFGFVVALLASCTAGDDESDRASADVDSAGIRIVATEGRAARARIGWRVDSTAELQIGRTDGDAAYLFARIRGIATVSGARIVILDGASSELRYFDGHGSHLSTLGRRGRGPEEFVDPWLVPGGWTDSVVVHDTRLRRLVAVSGDGVMEGVALRSVGGRVAGVTGGRALVRESSPTVFEGPDGPYRDTITYRLVDRANESADTLAILPGIQKYVKRGLTEFPATLVVPYSTDPAAAAGRSEIFVTDGREIRVYDPEGRLRRLIRLAEPDRAVTTGDMAAYGRLQGERSARDAESIEPIAEVYREMPIPTASPRFQRLLIDRTGLLWAEFYRTDEETRQDWMVFDDGGRAVGTVAMPAGLEVHEIGRDYVLGRWRDEFGVEYVRRHTLHREQPSRVKP